LSELEKKQITSNKLIFFGLSFLIGVGLIFRFFYVTLDVPIVTDGYFSFIYGVKTAFEGALPFGYTVTNTGWANFLSLFFIFSDKTDPLQLMNIQRSLSIIISTVTVIPLFFLLRNFTNIKFSLIGSFLFVIEPRLMLISLEGLNFSLFMFLFILSLSLFLKKTSVTFFLSFTCIAFASLIRYEGIILLIPLTILYLTKFNDKKSLYRFLGMIFIASIILFSIGILRMDATSDYCDGNIFGTCGEDGVISNFLSIIIYVASVFQVENQTEETKAFFTKNENENNTTSSFSSFIIYGLTNLGKFFGLSLLPFFGFLIFFNIIMRIKNQNFSGIPFDWKTVFAFSGIMILPALFAFVRGIDEIRYILILIPVFCIVSVSFDNITMKKISRNHIMIIICIVAFALSIIFVEMEKRDSIHDVESFKISQHILSLTNVTNSFNQDGYIKNAILFKDWPELPNADPERGGKLENQQFVKISTGNFNDLTEMIDKSRENELKYIVVDANEKLFNELREKPDKYPFLKKIFDSKNYNYMNEFKIFEIDYQTFDLIKGK